MSKRLKAMNKQFLKLLAQKHKEYNAPVFQPRLTFIARVVSNYVQDIVLKAHGKRRREQEAKIEAELKAKLENQVPWSEKVSTIIDTDHSVSREYHVTNIENTFSVDRYTVTLEQCEEADKENSFKLTVYFNETRNNIIYHIPKTGTLVEGLYEMQFGVHVAEKWIESLTKLRDELIAKLNR